VDPELHRQAQQSLEEARQEIEQLETRLKTKEAAIADLHEKLAKAATVQVNIENIRKSALFNLQQMNQLKRELQSRPDPATFTAQLADAHRCMKGLRVVCQRSRAALEKRNEAFAVLQEQMEIQKTELATMTEKVSELQHRLTQSESSLQQSQAELAACHEQVGGLQEQLAGASTAVVAEPEAEPEPVVALKRPSSPVTEAVESTAKKARVEALPEEVAPPPPAEEEAPVAVVPAIRRLRRNRASHVEPTPSQEAIPTDEDVGGEEAPMADTAAGESDAESGEILPEETEMSATAADPDSAMQE